jgi:type I restriction enzyme S subunit
MKLISYPEYRDTGVEWFNRIPAHWKCKKIKFSFKNKGSAIKTGPFGSQLKSEDMKGTDIKIYNQKNVIQGDLLLGDEYIDFAKFNELSAFEVFEEDLLVTTRGTIGRCKLVEKGAEKGILHPCLMRIQLDSKKFSHRFFIYLLQESGLLLIELMLKSNATTLDVIYSETLKNLVSPIPPINEQIQISNFLDYKTAQLDGLIKKKKNLIEKLNEKRLALITQAVTKGLNPDAPMKPSGVDWLGDVPVHWTVRRLKFAASYNDESLSETTEPDYELVYVDISSVDQVKGITNYEPLTFEKSPSRARRIVRDGDTIVSTVRTYLKAVAPIRNPANNTIVSTGFAVIRPNAELNPDFLSYFALSQGFIDSVVANSKGVSYPAINATELVCIPIAFPSEKLEQETIVNFLTEKLLDIDRMVSVNIKTIERLTEYRTALITAAVTGKIDVRGVDIPDQEVA